VVGELVASLSNTTLPGVLPAAWGAKVTVKGTFCPAGTVTGKVIPLSAYPVPFQAAEVTVMSEVPAVNVPCLTELLPTATFPKLKVAGDAESCPAPVPVLVVCFDVEDTP
jgi:hypothetical protein